MSHEIADIKEIAKKMKHNTSLTGQEIVNELNDLYEDFAFNLEGNSIIAHDVKTDYRPSIFILSLNA